MKIAAYPNNSGSRWWRLELPFKHLNKMGGFEARMVPNLPICEEIAEWADTVILQSCVDKKGLALLRYYQMEKGLKVICDVDDYMELNEDSPHWVEHRILDAQFVLRRAIQMANMITTTNEYLKNQILKYNPNTFILPNCLDLDTWDLPTQVNDSRYFNIGWAGSISHRQDIEMIVNPLTKILKEFPNARLFLIGDPSLGDLFKDAHVELALGCPNDVWPTRLRSFRLDLGLAPLTDTKFNKCKSNIKFLEYGISRIPGVYSNIVYNFRSFEPTFGLVADTEEQWYMCIKNLITCPNLRKDIKENSYSHVKSIYDLTHTIRLWEKAYKLAMKLEPGSVDKVFDTNSDQG